MDAMEHEAAMQWHGAHLREHFPELQYTVPEGQLRAFVVRGVHRAKSHGFLSTSEHAHWLNLMALLGADFDEDGSCPWAVPILNGQEAGTDRLHRLLEAAEEHVWGAETE